MDLYENVPSNSFADLTEFDFDRDNILEDYDASKIEVIFSELRGRSLCCGGYIYNLNKAAEHIIYWVCRERQLGCPGRVKTSVDLSTLTDVCYHNHGPNPAEIMEAKAKGVLRRRAVSALRSRRAYQKRSKCSDPTTGAAIAFKSTPQFAIDQSELLKELKEAMQTGDSPMEPKVLDELNIEGTWTTTIGPSPKRFLLYDNRSDGDSRLIVFATDAHLEYLSQNSRLYIDINPSLSPSVFKQLIIVQCDLGVEAVPLVYAMCCSNAESVYEELFTVIMSKCQDLNVSVNPTSFVIGYNINCLNVCRQFFGQTFTHSGCFYHLSQYMWHKIQQMDLTGLCEESENFRLTCCQLVALAFLPVGKVWDGMQCIKESIGNKFGKVSVAEKVKALVNNFDETFVCGKISGKQKVNGDLEVCQLPPVFEPESWNLFNKVTSCDPNTDNVLQSCAVNFTVIHGKTKPPVFEAIFYLKREERVVSDKIKTFNEAEGICSEKRVKSNLVAGHEKLARICQQFSEGEFTMEVFLVNIARNIRIGDW